MSNSLAVSYESDNNSDNLNDQLSKSPISCSSNQESLIDEPPYISNILPFFCLECSQGFEDGISLEQHAQDFHGENMENDSESCSTSISSKKETPEKIPDEPNLQIANKSYMCEYCKRPFAHHMRLLQHLRMYHDVDDFFICLRCDMKFEDQKGLVNHMRKNHRRNTGIKYSSYVEEAENSPFRTSSYPRKPNPVGVVVGEKPPGEANWTKTIENGEERIEMQVEKQEGERPYGCEICGSRFKLKAVLMRHIRCVHSESRPYLCNYCGSSFKIRNRLTTHIKMVHPLFLNDYVREWRNGNAIKPIPIVINTSL